MWVSRWQSSEWLLHLGVVVKSIVGGVSFSGSFLRLVTLVCFSTGSSPSAGVGGTGDVDGVDSRVCSDFNTAIRTKSSRLTHYRLIWHAATASSYAFFALGKASENPYKTGIYRGTFSFGESGQDALPWPLVSLLVHTVSLLSSSSPDKKGDNLLCEAMRIIESQTKLCSSVCTSLL